MKKTSFETLVSLKTNLHGSRKVLTNTTLSKIAIEVHKNKKISENRCWTGGGGPLPYTLYVWSVAARMLSTLSTNHGMPTWSRVPTPW